MTMSSEKTGFTPLNPYENTSNLTTDPTRLPEFGIFKAVVTAFSAETNTFSVQYEGASVSEHGCIWGSSVFSSLFGFNLNYIPPIGSHVVVAKGKPSIIVGAAPGQQGISTIAGYNSTTGQNGTRANLLGVSELGENPASYNQGNIPSDLLPGEFNISNAFGVAISLLHNFSKLSAGDLAKVECHLMNDMVRILSTNFKHHTAWGDVEFYNDGRLNVVINGTSYPHESLGLLSPDAPKFSADIETGVDLSNIDAINDTGRWRLAKYVGFLGNFIHTLVSDPPAALGSIATGAFQAGKARIHVNNDGTILCQSTSDIVLERVTKIVVPKPKKRWDDGSGYMTKDFENLEKKYLKIWDEDPKTIYHTAYQLREYARYLSLFHSYSRFLQLSEGQKAEVELPSENESPDPSRVNTEKDVKEANPSIKPYYDTYSTIRIMRDGSIVIWDGYGSSVVMSHGDIQCSATNNFTIEAGGDVRISAGGNLFVKARRNIEISSTIGGIKIKARAWFHALCEWGTLMLKSDALNNSDKDFEKRKPKTPHENDPQPIIGDAAIIIDATQGGMSLVSSGKMMLETTGFLPKEKAEEKDQGKREADDCRSVIIKSKYQHVKITAQESVFVSATRGMMALVASRARNIIMRAKQIFAAANNVTVGPDPDTAQINLGVDSTIPYLNSSVLIAQTCILSPAVPGPSPNGGDPHFNHVFELTDGVKSQRPLDLKQQGQFKSELGSSAKAQKFSVLNEVAYLEKVEGTENKPWEKETKFKFENFKDYVSTASFFFQSPAQQFLDLDIDNSTVGSAFYAENKIQFSESRAFNESLKKAPRTDNTTSPFPGKNAKFKVYKKGVSLHKPSAAKPASFEPTTDKLKMESVDYKFFYVDPDKQN